MTDISHFAVPPSISWSRHASLHSQDGVVLGADTRSTAGTTVADKNCEKIHYIASNIYCCGAGTAADTEATTGASSIRQANQSFIHALALLGTSHPVVSQSPQQMLSFLHVASGPLIA